MKEKVGVVSGGRKREFEPAVADGTGEAEDRLRRGRGCPLERETHELAAAAGNPTDENVLVSCPLNPGRRGCAARSKILQFAASGRDGEDITAGGSLVAHQSANKGNSLSIGRPARHGDLQSVESAGNLRWIQNHLGIAAGSLRVQLRDPPVVFSWRIGGNVGDGPGVPRPVEFVDVQVGLRKEIEERNQVVQCTRSHGPVIDRRWRELTIPVRGDAHHGNALDFDAVLTNHSGRGLHRSQGAGLASGSGDIEKSDGLSIRGKRGCAHVAAEFGNAAGRGAVEPREVKIGLVARGPRNLRRRRGRWNQAPM